MIISRKQGRVSSCFRRFAVFASAITLAAGALTVALAGPAAASGFTSIYLANSNTWGTYASGGVTSGSEINIKAPPWGTWNVEPQGSWSANGITGQAFEFAAVTTSNKISDLCLGTTTYYPVELLPCGANGTVWVAVSHANGWLLYSRYLLNRGTDGVLDANPLYSGSPLQVIPASMEGPGLYYTWLDTSGLID